MLTTDLALRMDPEYEKISRRFHADLDGFRLAFAKAWYKLLHRDMGPVERYLGPYVAEPQLWQDPVPAQEGGLVSESDVADLKAKVLESGLTVDRAGPYGVGLGRVVPRHRQARRRQRCPHPARAPEGLGGQRAGGAGRRAREARFQSRRSSTAPAAPRSRWPTSSCWPVPSASRRRPGTPATT